MEAELNFLYKEEFWYVSSFLNGDLLNGDSEAKAIENVVKTKLSNLTNDDIFRKDLKTDLLEMVHDLSLKCSWVPYLENFPYKDENSDREFNILGIFQFEVEYFKNNPSKKKNLTPLLIQQVPYIVLNTLKEYNSKPEKRGLFLDVESPIYVFVISNKTLPYYVEWSQENIERYKKKIGYWVEIYSGQWEDYSDKLHERRIQNNLSNRLSELHFIRRNSGFIFMAEENYKKFFDSYMRTYVLDPTPKMRTVLFALRSINESLDLLFFNTLSEEYINLKDIERKMSNLKYLRGVIQTKLSLIYNELDYNRRQHYTTVLTHLLKLYNLNDAIKRINEKFELIFNSMQDLYRKKSEQLQARTERGLNLLNLLFGAGILADLAGVIMIALQLKENDSLTIFLNGGIALFIIGILLLTIGYYIYLKIGMRESSIGRTVDAVIQDESGNIILIKRAFPPFKNYYALPGGFVKKGESKKQALIREVKEETGLNVKIVKKIGTFKEKGRDQRGDIYSTAFKCMITSDADVIKVRGETLEVARVPVDQLKNIDLAFDHKKILKTAGLID